MDFCEYITSVFSCFALSIYVLDCGEIVVSGARTTFFLLFWLTKQVVPSWIWQRVASISSSLGPALACVPPSVAHGNWGDTRISLLFLLSKMRWLLRCWKRVSGWENASKLCRVDFLLMSDQFRSIKQKEKQKLWATAIYVLHCDFVLFS